MRNELVSIRIKLRASPIKWMLICVVCIIILFFSSLVSVALASSAAGTPMSGLSPVALQATPAPSPTVSNVSPRLQLESTSVYSFSLASLGYEEQTLTSPYGRARYYFRLPENWTMEEDGVLDLDLSYSYNQISVGEIPSFYGDVTVLFNGETAAVLPIDEASLERYRLQVPLPLSLLNEPDRTQHAIEVVLDAGFLCEVPHRARLVIHPTSAITLKYGLRPLELDLLRYPRPFYQDSFEPDSVRFVVPAKPTDSDLDGALAVAAKLGDLTRRQQVISATTDVELIDYLSSASATLDEHLIVVGQPQNNRFLSLLDDVAELPVSLHQQQLEFMTQGPAEVSSGETLNYSFTVTNTLDQELTLSLISTFSPRAEFVECTPDCTEDSSSAVWSDTLLAPEETVSFSLVLEATDLLTDTTFENTTTLVEADLGPVNAGTLMSDVVMASQSDGRTQVSVAKKGDYFFVIDDRAVAEGDGIVQELLSPWSQNRAILVVTGLNDEALSKASQALASQTRFPGMSGSVALVRDAMPPTVGDTDTVSVEMTFGDLGYPDQVVQGGGSIQELNYYFDVPYGWSLTNDAFIDLHFSHSQLLDYEDSGLTVLLNLEPVTSVGFSDETANDGYVRLNLAGTNVQAGKNNRLTLEVDASMSQLCVDEGQAWVLVDSSSMIFLAHREETGLNFDLDYYPYPFHINPALTDSLFSLPDTPTAKEWEWALRLAANLGDSASGSTTSPVGTLGDGYLGKELADYHIIAVGRPSRNALTQQVNDQLPQPFLPDSDQIDQRLDDVVFRLPAGTDLGYIQMIPSPWNEMRAFVAVTGTTDRGVDWTVEVLTRQPWAIGSGNLVIVRDEQVDTIDTQRLTRGGLAVAIATAVPEATPVATGAPEATLVATATGVAEVASVVTLPSSSPPPVSSGGEQRPQATERPVWLIPLIVLTGLAVIAILAFAYWQARRRKI